MNRKTYCAFDLWIAIFLFGIEIIINNTLPIKGSFRIVASDYKHIISRSLITKEFSENTTIDIFETLDFCRNLLFLTKERALTIFDLLNYYLSLHDTYAKCISYNYLSLKSLLPRCTITNNGSLTYLHL